jgi:hypothetical protein
VTIDLDNTDVEVYGRHKRGVAFNHQGQRVGRPHVATWADTATVLAADLLAGNEDPRRDAPALLRRALAARPTTARGGRIRMRADAGQVSADPRARRRRTLPPDQRTLPLDELAGLDAVYGYSFIVTNLDVTSGDRAAAVEHWYRHRTSIENLFRDAKHGAALRHLPSGHPEVNTAWMWGRCSRQPHRLAAPAHRPFRTRRCAARTRRPPRPSDDRHFAAPADPRPRPAGPPRRRPHPAPATRLPPARRGPHPHPRLPTTSCPPPSRPRSATGTPLPEATLGRSGCLQPEDRDTTRSLSRRKIICLLFADSGLTEAPGSPPLWPAAPVAGRAMPPLSAFRRHRIDLGQRDGAGPRRVRIPRPAATWSRASLRSVRPPWPVTS